MPTRPGARRVRRVAIPPCRDPFINNLLFPVGQEPGAPERFWITTWNSVAGCTGALVDETGAFRLYQFADPLKPGFYSVAAEDLDTLWLWGSLTEVTRLELQTGRYESFPTGAPYGLVFHGMAYDPATGKLLAVANTYAGAGPTAVSFDTRRRETARVYEHVAPDWCLHGHFANGDGTYTVLAECPGTSLLHWDPQADTIAPERLRDTVDLHAEMSAASYYSLVRDDAGRVYFPSRGWYDPLRRRFARGGPRPDREMTWFARHGQAFAGVAYAEGDAVVGLWDLATGHVRETARCANCGLQNVNLTAGGKLVSVSMYGEFTRHDLQTGRLEVSRLLPAEAVQHTDCLRLIDRDRLLGTPFITQRFYEINLKTGRGYDCGRAAPGGGEILQTWRLGGKVYMAEYGGGRLVEYDPQVHPHFPENPRTVANPPGSMRPLAAADDGRCLYYACSAHYGHLGSAVTRYDTVTGENVTAVNPIPDQRIVSLAYDKTGKRLLAATHFDADCQSCPATSDKCFLAALAADDLRVLDQFEAPPGTRAVQIIGPVRRGRWLCRLQGSFNLGAATAADILLEIGGEPLTLAPLSEAWPVPAGWGAICPTTTAGRFVIQIGKRVELWRFTWGRASRAAHPVATLSTRAAGRRLLMDGDTVFLLGNTDILVLQDAASGA
ncbi:hypothetical protein LLH23_17260 [bacterium]|nr:hypothetical protein [bacterium]